MRRLNGDPPTVSLLAPLQPSRSLTEDLVRRLGAEIRSGSLQPGERLPTEQALVSALGVSRTVVREAVAALKADGLVITRQGVGAFVAPHAQRRQFRIDADELASLPKLLNVMELRTGVEIEAAGLAATRRTNADLRAIARALAAIDEALAHEDAAVRADFEFHCAIAEATHNPLFREFLQFLGDFIIPRQSVRALVTSAADRAAYLQRVQEEHRAIQEAIRLRDGGAAQEAVRTHLENSQARYRQLQEGATRKR
jgi:GntR family transcriptional regulator, transcriptional repressor for pyruvate dehydrogenase complex